MPWACTLGRSSSCCVEGLGLESGHQLGTCPENDLEVMTDKSDKAEGDTRVQWGSILVSIRMYGPENLEKYVKNDTQSSRDRRRHLSYLESQGNAKSNPVTKPTGCTLT